MTSVNGTVGSEHDPFDDDYEDDFNDPDDTFFENQAETPIYFPEPYQQHAPCTWPADKNTYRVADEVFNALGHGPDSGRFRRFSELQRHPTEERAYIDFVKLILPYTGDDFWLIDEIARRSFWMSTETWAFKKIGPDFRPYREKVIYMAAIELYREHQAQAGTASPAGSEPMGYEFFRANVLTAPVFVALAPLHVDWFIDGYLAPGAITELDAKIKYGKTEFALNWAKAIANGEAEVMGRAVRKGRVLYLTEQGASFRSALSRSGAAECPDLHVLPREATWKMAWEQVVDLAAHYCKEFAIDVLVVDTLSKFAKIKDEDNSVEAMRAMEPLQRAMAHNLAILVLRHDRKSGGEVGDSARGSSAWGGEADIIIDMQKVSRDIGPATYRMLQSKGRYGEATPDELLVDFVDARYVLVGGGVARRQTIYDRLKAAIGAAGHEHRRRRSEVLDAVHGQAAYKREALDKLIADGEVMLEGEGTRDDPYYVWLMPVAKVGQSSAEQTN